VVRLIEPSLVDPNMAEQQATKEILAEVFGTQPGGGWR